MSADRPTYDPSPEVLRILARRYGHKRIEPSEVAVSDEDFLAGVGRVRFETIMPPPDLLAKAVAAGVMFTEPRTLDHDGWISAARQAAAALTAREVGDAFLASLTSRRMDLRSALASYALTHNLPEHSFTEWREWSWSAGCGQTGQTEPRT